LHAQKARTKSTHKKNDDWRSTFEGRVHFRRGRVAALDRMAKRLQIESGR
jgi:hypothetical protein